MYVSAILLSHECCVAGGKKAGADGVGGELAQFVAGKSLLVWASRYSLAISEPKKAGSSELSVTSRPGIEIAAQRVGGKGGANPGADVRCGIQLQGVLRAFNS